MGDTFCSHEIPLNTGVDFVRQSINIALGREIDEDSPFDLTFQYLNDTFSPRQDVSKIIIPDWISKNPDIKLLEVRCKIGDIIAETVHHPSRAGLVITTGPTKSEAIALAEKVVNSVEIHTLK